MSELSLFDIQETLRRYNSNLEWFQNNYESLKKEYSRKAIAVIDKNEVDVDDKVEALLDRLKQKNVNLQTTVIRYLIDDDTMIVV